MSTVVPYVAALDSMNLGNAYPEVLRQQGAAPVTAVVLETLTDFSNQFSRQLRLWIAFAASARAPLCVPIATVVLRRPEKQMAWVHARRIVAVVTDVQSRANRAFGDFVGKAMRSNASSFIRERAVMARAFTSSPNPAGICFSDLTPEANNRIFDVRHHTLILPSIDALIVPKSTQENK